MISQTPAPKPSRPKYQREDGAGVQTLIQQIAETASNHHRANHDHRKLHNHGELCDILLASALEEWEVDEAMTDL